MCVLTPKQCLHFAVPLSVPTLPIKRLVITKAFETFTVLCLTSVVIYVIPTCLCPTCNAFIIPMYLKGINTLTLLAECDVIVEYRRKIFFPRLPCLLSLTS
jgi:hypothetical protein